MTTIDSAADALASTIPAMPARVFRPPAGGGTASGADPDLPQGYVEEEYLVSGLANVYQHDADRRLVVQDADRAYTTRVIVRYPADPAAFSGDLVFEAFHPEGGQATLWSNLREYVAERGDAYCGVTVRREPYNFLIQPPQTATTRLVAADPVRYADIDFDESGLTWDVISQVGRLVRSDVAENPLRQYRPRLVVQGGYSGAGATMLFYVNEGFPALRMPDGGPVFDAFLVGEPSRYPSVSTAAGDADAPADDDPRQKVQPRQQPVIQLYSTEFAFEFGKGRFRADSDEPGDRYRLWVVPGAYHAGRAGARALEQLGTKAGEARYPYSTVPLDHYFPLAVDHLKRWARGEGVPPHAPVFQMLPDGGMALDALGNQIGGVPVPTMDVPSASHPENGPDIMSRLLGGEVPFGPEKLRELYGTREAYLLRMERRVRELIGLGWLLPMHAKEVMDQARTVDFGPTSG